MGSNRKDEPERLERNTPPSQTDVTGPPDDLEFVVEEKTTDGCEFVGGQRQFPSEETELKVESTSDLMEQEAAIRAQDSPTSPELPSEPPDLVKERTAYPASSDAVSPTSLAGSASAEADQKPTPGSDPGRDKGIKKLSRQEIATIEKSLYSSGAYLTDREKEELMHKLGEYKTPSAGLPGPTPGPDGPSGPSSEPRGNGTGPRMADRARGIAYYYKNYIQVTGRRDLRLVQEMSIDHRPYELRPKRFNRKAVLAAAGILFVALLFAVGSLFISETNTGKGEIVGVVLDDNGNLYVRQATIRFPALDQTTVSNEQGFFRSGLVPEGTHRIEYVTQQGVVKVEHATVVEGQITTLSLRPEHLSAVEQGSPNREPTNPRTAMPTRPSPPPKATESTVQAAQKTAGPKSPPAPKQTSTAKGPGNVTLAANVAGARLAIDGDVLGAGNLTYRDIAPGKHSYEVSKDGFETARGTITVSAGEDYRLKVDLVSMSQNVKAETFSEDDFYYSGLAALDENDVTTAVADLSAAIERKPGFGEAYLARAEAYRRSGDREAAYNDCIRAAEIYHISKDINQAITAYSQAIELNDQAVAAYLGRAGSYLAKKEELAAIADYELVTRLDRRNFDAYYGLGEARFRQGQYKTASKHFKDARSLEKDNPLPHQYLMLCYLAMDNIKEVKRSFEKFQELASEEQMARLQEDSRFSAVFRIVETD